RNQCWAIARNHEPLDATGSAGCQNDITRWDAHSRCNQSNQGSVGVSFACSRPNPKLEDGTPLRQHPDALDSVASAFWRQPDGERNTLRRERPRLAHHWLEHVRIDVPDDD